MVALSLMVVGCGSTNKTYETVENNITVDEPYTVPDGLAVIIDGSNGATVNLEQDTIIIDCGGTCGDITIGNQVEQAI